MKNTTINRIKNQLMQLVTGDGVFETKVAGLKIARREEENKISTCLNEPLIILIIQGSKNAVYGSQSLSYKGGDLVISGIDMPSTSYVSKGSVKEPFLAISMPIDKAIVSSLITVLPKSTDNSEIDFKAVAIGVADEVILDAFTRLIDTLSTENDSQVLAPMIIREIHYHILTSSLGSQLRLINTFGSMSNNISKIISYVKENFNKRLSVEELAKRANMASSTFRRRFTDITTLSPIQYQKKLRLYEAQRLLVSSNDNATSVAYIVGYESVTQFNREYKRLFGETPKRNMKNILQL